MVLSGEKVTENSIQCNISEEDLISEVRMLLGDDFQDEKIVVIVEGISDFRLLKKILDEEKFTICESISGKEGVIKIACTVFKDEMNVIGIIDRDYQVCTFISKIFAYDYSCAEMMIISNRQVRKSIKTEYFSTTDFNFVLKNIFQNLYFLSLLREHNFKYDSGINFRNLPFGSMISIQGSTILLNPVKIIAELKNRNSGDLGISDIQITKLIADSTKLCSFDEYLNITQGHDFVKMLGFHCNNENASNCSVKEENVSSILRIAYSESEFKNTKLWMCLKDYCSKLNINI